MIADHTHRRIGHNRSAAPSSVLITSTTANPAPTTVTSSSAPPRSRTATCTNCSASGHSIEHCWEPGGGDVGGRNRYLATRAKAHIATDPIPIPDITTPTQSTSMDPLQDTSPTHHSSVVPPVSASPAQSDIFYAYASCDQPTVAFISTVSTPYSDFVRSLDPMAFAAFQQRFNTILDSGCTNHIIRDRCFFWTYHPEQATPVGTANCSILNTLARGEVHFTVLVDGHLRTICL